MAAMIPEDIIEQVRQASDIVDILGQYVRLKKRGRNFLALCPFHNEKTPSFSVSPDKQIYHCFGCG
ncbi:MAG: DNA primase, partial [Candidatus Zixiibacteriota bacterium]